ncbi:hypothetical protein ACTXT7_014230 [Hymenolepis weldensis]
MDYWISSFESENSRPPPKQLSLRFLANRAGAVNLVTWDVTFLLIPVFRLIFTATIGQKEKTTATSMLISKSLQERERMDKIELVWSD